MQVMQTKEDYQAWYDQRKEKSLEEFFTYLKFPSISAQPSFKENLLECATWVETYMNSLGFKTQRWEGDGHPTIFAERIVDENAPTILFYGHYDVQPPEPYDLWESEPFDPTIRDGRVYARGAEDNKGQNYYCMLAIKAFLEKNPEAEINLKYVIEGEEEMGSELLEEVAPTKEKELKADYLLIVDAGMGSKEKPGLCIGCRGITTMEIECVNGNTDLHSGAYGGVVYNPLRALSEVLAKVIDEKGRITIPGFYDDIRPLSKEEMEEIDITFDQSKVINEIGECAFHAQEGFTTTETNCFQPTFEINGMWGGYMDDGFKTVIPNKAYAKISCRLVPDQDSEKMFELVSSYLKEQFPKSMKVDVKSHGGGPSAWGSPKIKATQVVKKAYEDVFGSCQIIYSGGSIPISALLAKHSGGEFVLPGVGLACDLIHAPNESFGLDQLLNGFLIITKSLELFAEN